MTERESERPLIHSLSPRSEGRGEPVAPSPVEPGEGGGGEGERWRRAMPTLADRLREFGYDIEPSRHGELSGGSIVARRDRGDRAEVIAIDAGGRFRVTITWMVGEWPSWDQIAGVPVGVVDAVSRVVTVTGQLESPEQVVELVGGMSTIAPRASVTASEPSGSAPERQSSDEFRIPY
ncbi:MAG TPA: hypothetical protein VK356_12310 [Thermomicrobiales bacterium]|nr:hypothetical protein [Thermomicrobiales bacterium]